jgi:hypothetical protein
VKPSHSECGDGTTGRGQLRELAGPVLRHALCLFAFELGNPCEGTSWARPRS